MKQMQRNIILVGILLSGLTIAAYWGLQNHAFLGYDDGTYVTENAHVQKGLTLDGVVWAFTTGHAGNWHPLTWLSHMLDFHLFGLNPAGHHLSSLFLHIVSTILLFLVLVRMTGALWQAALVAAVFALHPLHVESVAWAAERKDVLSGVFWMLTLLVYVRYVERPSLLRYLPVILFFALGLLSKPMLVTLPFVLLLLDYWPLGRLDPEPPRPSDPRTTTLRHAIHLIREKAPLFLLSAISSIITYNVQRSGGAVTPGDALPLESRLANVAISYVEYMLKTLWPVNLGVFYPFPVGGYPVWMAAGAFTLIVVSVIALILVRRSSPYLFTGWFWYLGTLVPVIGFVQAGAQAMADRYMYLPLIGLSMMAAWGFTKLAVRRRSMRVLLTAAAVLVTVSMVVGTRAQLSYWKDDVTLFNRTLAVTTGNFIAHGQLGAALGKQGRLDEAVTHLAEALRLRPDDGGAHNNMGICLALQNRFPEAADHFREATRLDSSNWSAHYNLGLTLLTQGQLTEAVHHLATAARLRPDSREIQDALSNAVRRMEVNSK